MWVRLAVVIGLLGAFAGAALAARPDVVTPMIGVPQPRRAQINWILKCQGCHRPDASGSPDTAPALAGNVAIFTRLAGGRAYLGSVPGVADAALDDAELAELLNWTLQRFDPGNITSDFRPYTAREIHQLRRSPLRTTASVTRSTILARKIRPD